MVLKFELQKHLANDIAVNKSIIILRTKGEKMLIKKTPHETDLKPSDYLT